MFKKFIPVLVIIFTVFIFFWQVFFKGLMPIPADTIVGLYHPYRDSYSKEYPNGIPFKNFLTTDPVRQQYPWKKISHESLNILTFPAWNPYSFSGTPFIANFQSSFFYPLNLIGWVFSLENTWIILIILQPMLAFIFMYFFLRNLKLNEYSSFFGGLVFSFSAFFTSWLQWGNVLHSALWIPLIFLSIDKIVILKKRKVLILWILVLIFSISASIFAGHLQTAFYVILTSFLYVLFRAFRYTRKLLIILSGFVISGVIALPQLIPTINFINLSGRGVDQDYLTAEGWFIPVNHLIQFVSPDFFGNPSTLNYWGVWNYGELTAYIGIAAIILSMYVFFFKRTKEVLFFCILFIFSLVFSLPTLIAKLPFMLDIPLLSSSQPTRLILLMNLSLAILSAIGLEVILKEKKVIKILIPIFILGFIYLCLFIFTFFNLGFDIKVENILVARRNLIFPFIIFIFISMFLIALIRLEFKKIILVVIILITIFDLFRFSWKFNTFSERKYLFPQTKSINFIKDNLGVSRIATNDPRILPPNFNIIYGIYSVEGYDPLYVNEYAQLISAINRNRPDISTPFGFNRIIRVENFENPVIDLLGIKYLLSFEEIKNEKFTKVFEEGQMKIFENKDVLPKAFFVENVFSFSTNEEIIKEMFNGFDPSSEALVLNDEKFDSLSKGKVEIISYDSDEIVLKVSNDNNGFLVINDVFYPTWHATIDEKENLEIYKTNYIFRGIFIPKGDHLIKIYNNLL